jgi:mono/diheme cytochrome c family protein
LGEFAAMDLNSREIKWRFRTAAPMNTAALTTAGGLVFAGDWDRNVYAFNDVTGEVLWHSRLTTSAQGYPMTYLAGGDQYLAIPSGTGGASWSTLVPSDLVPEVHRPDHGNSLFVFRLPGKKLPSSSELTRQVPKVLVEPTRPTAEHSVKDGVYSQRQARNGSTAYTENCSACHGDALQGVGTAPGLTGTNFQFVWSGTSLQTLFESIKRTMPINAPGSLSDETYINIVAYLLEHSGYPSGEENLQTSELGNILIEDK